MPTVEQSVAQLQQTNAELVTASDALTNEVTSKLGAINSTVAAKMGEVDTRVNSEISGIQQQLSTANTQYEQWLSTRHVGFSLVDTLMDQSNTPITLPPRFATLEEAETFQFSAAEDYSPETNELTHYTDFYNNMPGRMTWFAKPSPTQFTGHVSVYANIAVGNTSQLADSRIAVLMNRLGATSTWIEGQQTEYNKPRALLFNSENLNLKITGSAWGITNYDECIALAENAENTLSAGLSTIRIINLGHEPIHIKGLWIVHHGHNKEA
ncbi:hypothetical protein JL49_08025 [Pseudoalteromonas luteoviolacea]|nr:hypothetical protein JL49_08025 [Pseudoalteromonas luteoviolacea]